MATTYEQWRAAQDLYTEEEKVISEKLLETILSDDLDDPNGSLSQIIAEQFQEHQRKFGFAQ